MSTNNNSNNEGASRKIVEDSPTMRSVALMAPPMMPRMQPLTPPLKMSLADVNDESKSYYVTPTATNLKNQDDNDEAVVVDCFPALPVGYFLERTHVRIHDATPEEVMSRVSSILTHESVATRYEKNKTEIVCESVDLVEFMVRFFQDDECLIVEAQRCSGCSYSFHQLVKSVLRSAKGLPPSSVNHKNKPLALPKCLPRSSQEEQMACTREGIEIAVSLMKQGSLDAQLMALESLVQISQSVEEAAEMILGNSQILHFLLSFLATHKDNETQVGERSNERKLHRVAVTVVANCLESLQKNNQLEHCWKVCGDSLSSVLTSLMTEISVEQPHEACQAIRVFQVLSQDGNIQQRMQKEALVRIARTAEDQRHAHLRELSQQFLQTWEHERMVQ